MKLFEALPDLASVLGAKKMIVDIVLSSNLLKPIFDGDSLFRRLAMFKQKQRNE